MLTKEELIAFEEDIAAEFNAGKIRAPVHLYSGGESELIEIFKDIRPQDWILCSWRSHYQCLLKGVPSAELKAKIMAGYSIALNFPEHRIVSSAIIGGVLPIAVGLGMAIKRSGEDARVFVFSGDMTSETGGFYECLKYTVNFNLPVHFIVEDNNQSVCTDTRKVWNTNFLEAERLDLMKIVPEYLTYFKYTTGKFPHAGSGSRVQF